MGAVPCCCESRPAGVARHDPNIAAAVIGFAGLVLGLIVGRWWALIAAALVGLAVGLFEEVEVQGSWLGFAYGLAAAVGIALGVLLRRFANRNAKPS